MAASEPESRYTRALREVTSAVQILIYRRETSPVRDRVEVEEDLQLRLLELRKSAANGKITWRRRLLELAAYAVFAAVSDE
jgi:hypothetical protein